MSERHKKLLATMNELSTMISEVKTLLQKVNTPSK